MDWQLIFNAINDPGMILDLENRILEVNEKTIVITGMSSDELIGRYCYEIFHGQPAPPADCPYESLLASQKPQTCAMTVETLDKIYMVSLSPLFNASGEMEKVLHIARDITAQQMASEDHAKLQTILNTAPLGIGITKDRIINYMNQKALDISGYRAEEIIGKSSRIFFASNEEFERIGKLRSSQLGENDISSIEAKFQHKDGRLIDYYLTSAPIHPGEPEKGFVVTIIDISKLKEAEAAKAELQVKWVQYRKVTT